MSSTKFLSALIVLVVALWFGTSYLITLNLPSWTERGQFGDLFGAVNALFSGLAFAGLFYTIFLQRSELALQREELALQRLEMQGSREQLANQAHAQHSLFLATVAQVRVAAIQAEIEAIKIDAGDGYQKSAYSNDVRVASKRIAEVTDKLEAGNIAG